MEPTSVETSPEPSPWSRSTGALAAWLALSGFLILIAFGVQLADEGAGGSSDALFEYSFAAGSVVIYSVIAALTWLIARAFGEPRRALGLRRFPLRWLWIALGVTVLSVIVSALLEPILHAGEEQGLAPERWQEDKALAFVLNAGVVVLVVPFVEELFFRGLGVRVLGFLGKWVAIVATALVFALAHGILVGIPALGIFALALAWVRWESESVWPGFIAHAAYNLVGILAAAYVALDEDGTALAALF
jgi:membrane protease YdiL (CAAX protease family)